MIALLLCRNGIRHVSHNKHKRVHNIHTHHTLSLSSDHMWSLLAAPHTSSQSHAHIQPLSVMNCFCFSKATMVMPNSGPTDIMRISAPLNSAFIPSSRSMVLKQFTKVPYLASPPACCSLKIKREKVSQPNQILKLYMPEILLLCSKVRHGFITTEPLGTHLVLTTSAGVTEPDATHPAIRPAPSSDIIEF